MDIWTKDTARAIRPVISGANGFLGSWTARQCLGRGAVPILLVRKGSDASRCADLRSCPRVFYESLTDIGLAERLRALKPTNFLHTAWSAVAKDARDSSTQRAVNLPLATASISLAAAAGCRQWVGIGSQAEYGLPNRKVTETEPLKPVTEYGKAKVAVAAQAADSCRELSLDFAWIRLFSAYGPMDAPEFLIPYVIRELMADRSPELSACEQVWDYLYVEDAGEAVAAVAAAGASGVYNLGGGAAVSLKSVVQLICDAVEARVSPKIGAVPYRADQIMHLEADIGKLSQVTGWRPRVSLEAGIKRTVEWMRRRAQAA